MPVVLRKIALREYGVKKIAGARAVQGGDRNRVVLKAELIELVEAVRYLADLIHLIYGDNNRLPGLFQHYGNLTVVRHKSGVHIAHKDYDVRRAYRELCLKPHGAENYVVGLWLYTSGIYEDKALSAPLRLRIYSVSGNARGILYYGAALSDYFIEQRALPDVRAPDYRYYRL